MTPIGLPRARSGSHVASLSGFFKDNPNPWPAVKHKAPCSLGMIKPPRACGRGAAAVVVVVSGTQGQMPAGPEAKDLGAIASFEKAAIKCQLKALPPVYGTWLKNIRLSGEYAGNWPQVLSSGATAHSPLTPGATARFAARQPVHKQISPHATTARRFVVMADSGTDRWEFWSFLCV